jgi:hypothetical protein
MKVGIIQSNFLPWRGYFDFVGEVDLFILHDDLQYTKGDWRNRNRIKTPRGPEWITVPVRHTHTEQLIEQTKIDYSTPWAGRMLNRVRESYRTAPHFEPYFSELAELLHAPATSISDLNLRLILWACRHLQIRTPIEFSHTYAPHGRKTERLVSLLRKVGATSYLSGPAARAYLVPALLEEAGIALEYKSYGYREYPQLHPPYDPNVSILDLLFMMGPESTRHLDRDAQ